MGGWDTITSIQPLSLPATNRLLNKLHNPSPGAFPYKSGLQNHENSCLSTIVFDIHKKNLTLISVRLLSGTFFVLLGLQCLRDPIRDDIPISPAHQHRIHHVGRRNPLSDGRLRGLPFLHPSATLEQCVIRAITFRVTEPAAARGVQQIEPVKLI